MAAIEPSSYCQIAQEGNRWEGYDHQFMHHIHVGPTYARFQDPNLAIRRPEIMAIDLGVIRLGSLSQV